MSKESNLTGIIREAQIRVLLESSRSIRQFQEYGDVLERAGHTKTKKRLDRMGGLVQSAIDAAGSCEDEDMLKFTLENYASLRSAQMRIAKLFADENAPEEISAKISSSIDESLLGVLHDRILKSDRWIGLLNGVSALSANYFGVDIATAIYTVGTVSSVRNLLTDTTVPRAMLTNGALLTGAAAWSMYGFMFDDVEPGSDPSILKALTILAHLPASFAIQTLLRYGFENSKVTEANKRLQNAQADFDDFLRAGVAIEHGHRNLRYVDGVASSKFRHEEEFREQIDNLEEVLLAYVNGNAELDDLQGARIRNRKRVVTVVPEPMIKTGYTEDEYTALKDETKETRNKKKRSTKVVSPKIEQTVELPHLEVSLSEELDLAYDVGKERVSGYGIKALVDSSRSKIESMVLDSVGRSGGKVILQNHNAKLIRDRDAGKHLLKRLRSRHDIPEGANVYRMQPIGAMRTIFMSHEGKYKVLEIMSHTDYDEMLKQ